MMHITDTIYGHSGTILHRNQAASPTKMKQQIGAVFKVARCEERGVVGTRRRPPRCNFSENKARPAGDKTHPFCRRQAWI